MVLAITFDEAKKKQVRRDSPDRGGGISQTPFFGSRKGPDSPLASLNEVDAGRASRPHFHTADQFQVVIAGKCKLGRHEVAPFGVHFTRAYTPYGPLVPDANSGVKFFVLRAHLETGSQNLPEQLEQLRQVPNRQPWQVTRQVSLPVPQSPTLSASTVLEPIAGIQDEKGLAAYTLSMTPNTTTSAPDPSRGEGQYLAVLEGSLFHENRELKEWSLVFVYPQEDPFQITAGPQGLKALILNFPKRLPLSVPTKSATSNAEFKKWQCELCSFTYDEELGMPDEGIAPGTHWQDVPETWSCPDCNASKADFQMIELVAAK